jgi:hypothetical protein
VIGENTDALEIACATLITECAPAGLHPAGPPATLTARAFMGVLEAVAVELAGQDPHDVELMERAVRGLLGVSPEPPSPIERRR